MASYHYALTTKARTLLQVQEIQCQYESDIVVDKVSFHVNDGDICSLLGPSGCGKTTILRAIAGFQALTHGNITLRDHCLSQPNLLIAPEQRNIGMVFQDYALFPHLSVKDNICFGLRKQPSAQQNSIAKRLLDLVQLGNVAHRYPHELSGGQQQRVALARALAPSPDLLLLDEPFSNLDAELRKRLSLEVRDILKELHISAILVTHDQQEAFAFSDQVGLLHGGQLQQWDIPFNLYHEPSNRTVADFIGEGCFLPGVIGTETNTITTELGTLMGNRPYPWLPGSPVDVLLRPDDIVLSDFGGISATVEKKVFSGSATLYTLSLPTGSRVEALLPSHRNYAIKETVQITTEADHLIAFSREA
ncbi:Fe(3+) ions import ATP-binding protein FbpC 2 [Zhongshania aliphaticivorans]|uniref:Fe(3+) ions import ATP-binding protein FbpC 2 n=1 Tax=Zhongshania aliphaticivorans TaxID=1470434 RepID=A0A5S9MZ90_9GAMM|nr:ABC transporter ATP-binding protein [Zhongshania aliphaticivorans]CAA0080933.1 Fe(3+) ions import ATP-binding protein FbpC 2 [Zhongshania aliphaticivorans]CAA0085396.1 Fe(3+) ions import ATP-binding protein FbpC 2 [Zhongshania aliphaticivorans]